ncbi:glycosyltransferase family 4 protein [Sphingomonas sp. AX6]|uniref:glycosyltransferase family 4 protein n=1 Tax=Sphingomonas sp. AX6 TaxID=2653171 RepID=UPI0012EF5DE3|nr:glycosyltransferase family 4 protein [Sphingomonas sp. AX6]VXC47208.1 Glycosyl transferases group 1 [Sphingomonas sp. AX6]
MNDHPSNGSRPHGGGMKRWLDRGGRILRQRWARLNHAVARRRDLAAVLQDERPHVLLVTNDLSRSGAPLLVFEMASLLIDDGVVPVVASPVDGPFAAKLRDLGVRVFIDPMVRTSPAWISALASHARWAICNTIDTADVARTVAERTPVLWYLHEVSLLEDRLADPQVHAAVLGVSVLWAGSALCAEKIAPLRPDVTIVPYGVAPLGDPPTKIPDRPLRTGIFGSIEPRKGQDLAVEAMALLSSDERRSIALTLYGRILDRPFAEDVLERARALGVDYAGELDHGAYKAAIAATDAVLVSSRDDTLPIVSIDALGLGRMLLLSPDVGTAAWLEPGVDVLVAPGGDAAGLATLLKDALSRMAEAPTIGSAARRAFDAHFSRTAFRDRLRTAAALLERPS